MTDKRKELLSSLIDGEASELEVHRFLREFGGDAELTHSWSMYQHIRMVVRSRDDVASDPYKHQDLFRRISEDVAAEASHNHVFAIEPSRKKVVVGSLALAASLFVAIFVTTQANTDSGLPGVSVASTPTSVQAQGNQSLVVRSTAVSSPAASSQTSELIELDEEKQRRLRSYLNQHERMTRMDNKSQLVGFSPTRGVIRSTAPVEVQPMAKSAATDKDAD